MRERDRLAYPGEWDMDDKPWASPGLTKYERTVLAVVESGVCGSPGEYSRSDGGKTPDEKYSYQVLRVATAAWDALEKTTTNGEDHE